MALVIDRRRAMAGLGGALAFGLSAERAQARTERLVVAMPISPRTLEPVKDVANVTFRVCYNIFDNLIGTDYSAGAKLVPALATSWKRVSPTVLDLTLRDGVKFHNGEVMTAEDVAFSFGPERTAGEKAPGYAITRPFLGTFEKVEALDRLSVRVTTRSADPLIEQRLAGWAGQIISKKAYLAAPSFDAWQKAPVGAGPFKVQEFRDGVRVVLKAHEEYFGGKPAVDELVFQIVPELASRMNALATGEADIITEVSPDQFKSIVAMDGCEVVGGAIQNIRVLVFHQEHPVLKDVRVRRALALAIDRKAIVDSLYYGKATIPPGHQNVAYGPLYMPDYRAPGFDPDKAKALLKEAGYNGEPIPYRLVPNYYTLQLQTAQVLVEMWRAVGLNVNLEVKENWAAVHNAEGAPRGIRDWSNTIFWNDPLGVLVRLYGPQSSVQNTTKEWKNEAFNQACAVLEGSLDVEQRKAAFRKMLEIYDEIDPPGTVLHDYTVYYGKKKGVRWNAYQTEYMDFRANNMG